MRTVCVRADCVRQVLRVFDVNSLRVRVYRSRDVLCTEPFAVVSRRGSETHVVYSVCVHKQALEQKSLQLD